MSNEFICGCNVDLYILDDVENAIKKHYGDYDTDTLSDVIEGLLIDHVFTSKDSIQDLIYRLEKLRDNSYF